MEDEPSIRNVLYSLLASIGYDGDVATSGRQALAMIRRESFDAVLLDLRCLNLDPPQMVSQIRQIRPHLIGRVLVITGEVTDSQTLSWIEQSHLPTLSHQRLIRDLKLRVNSLLGLAGPAQRPA